VLPDHADCDAPVTAAQFGRFPAADFLLVIDAGRPAEVGWAEAISGERGRATGIGGAFGSLGSHYPITRTI